MNKENLDINNFDCNDPNEAEKSLIMGFRMLYSVGIKEDKEKAKEIFMKYSSLNNKQIMIKEFREILKICSAMKYYYGWDKHKRKDNKKSMSYFNQYLKSNKDTSSKNELIGYIYHMIAKIYQYDSKNKNMKKAVDYYERSIKTSNNTVSMIHLGEFYEKAFGGFKEDLNKAMEYYQKASDEGNAEGLFCLSIIYKDGKGSIKKNIPKAIELYEKASERGNINAMFNLAIAYKDGKGVKKNVPRAIELYEKACESGNKNAMYNLAIIYKKGSSVKKNINKAIELYKKSAELGNTNALYNLSYLYEQGEGVEKNMAKSIELLERASGLGDIEAMSKLANIFKDGKVTPVNFDKAAYYFFEAYSASEIKDDKYDYKQKFKKIISRHTISWKRQYHCYLKYKNKELLDQQLLTVLLIYKTRKSSSNLLVKKFNRSFLYSLLKALSNFQQVPLKK
eukprot:TRINITY_DN2651_c3_g1_i1.p1 TRINITY_DN2651_c3_g1~~TRINITY_DN2651_c3_g1_i1.p1  ORF type:complete len:451 (-),score=136.58 TRINITY_DN2651_c3_g1_i1:27-1379(-)